MNKNEVSNFINYLNTIKDIYDLNELSILIEYRKKEIVNNKNNNKNHTVYIQEIDYKGTGKSWVSLLDSNLKNIVFLKKIFLKKEKNRIFYKVELEVKKVYLINTEGNSKEDDRYFLFIDEYNKGHKISYYKKEEVKNIIKEITEIIE